MIASPKRRSSAGDRSELDAGPSDGAADGCAQALCQPIVSTSNPAMHFLGIDCSEFIKLS
jgi:hypothetical protein